MSKQTQVTEFRASACGSECRGFESHRAPKVESKRNPCNLNDSQGFLRLSTFVRQRQI